MGLIRRIRLNALTGILLMVELFGGNVEPLDEERVAREVSDIFLRGIQKP